MVLQAGMRSSQFGVIKVARRRLLPNRSRGVPTQGVRRNAAGARRVRCGVVDVTDLLFVLSAWGACVP